MKNLNFAEHLNQLRKQAGLTTLELAELSDVPRTLISGLENNSRRIGELQATRLGIALGLCGVDLQEFIYLAINTCSERVLVESKGYPAELINLVTRQLRNAGILPEQVNACVVDGTNVSLILNNGRQAKVATALAYA
jgi:transcriptional regulator with XRE-family HTH domain